MENTFGMNIIPENDLQRVEALKRYKILDTPPEGAFDNVARLATQIFGVPIALVSLVDAEQVYFKANIGMGKAKVTPRGVSLCSLAILKPEVTVFENAPEEPCLLVNPNVAGSFGLKFYAGAPLTTHDGFRIGTLCIIDKTPRAFLKKEEDILIGLAKIVMDEIELRLSALTEFDNVQESNEELYAINEELSATNEELSQTQSSLETSYVQLAESEGRLRYLLNDAPVAIAVMKGRELIVESANKKVLEIWGKRPDIIGKPLQDALPELKGQDFLQWLDNVYTNGEPFVGNEVKALLEQSGKIEDVYSNFVYHPIKNADGTTDSIMLVATVVTEQVKARNDIERLNKQFNLAVSAARLGIWHIAPRTKALQYNDVLAKIFGYESSTPMTYDQAIGQVVEKYRDAIVSDIERSISKGVDYDITYQQKRFNDGKVIWLRSLGKVTQDANGELETFSGIVMDITEAKEDEQRKNDFIAMVSHELKTPLTSMSGYLQMLGMVGKKNHDEFSVTTIDRAKKQVGKMESMINGFLNVSRLESGKIHIDHQIFDMAKLVKESEAESLATITSHKVIYAPVEKTIVNADFEKIGQVINNLISNAVKYSPQGTTIRVACETIDGIARVCVQDEGMGIRESDIDKLFDRYYRVESADMRSKSGFGIGLYLCAEIIKRHNGKIWVESEIGNGSTFYFNIPIHLEQ